MRRRLPKGSGSDLHGVQVSYRVSRETWRPFGSDAPGMSFSDCPVCNLSVPQTSDETCGSSQGLPCSSKAFPTANLPFRLGHASATSSSGQPSWASGALQRSQARRPFTTGLPSPARIHSQRSSLSADRPEGRLRSLPGMFRPGHTPELSSGPARTAASLRKVHCLERSPSASVSTRLRLLEPVLPSGAFLPATVSYSLLKLSSYALSLYSASWDEAKPAPWSIDKWRTQ